MNKINELFNDPSEMKRLVNECENYSQTHFYANAEEKHFYEFIEVTYTLLKIGNKNQKVK